MNEKKNEVVIKDNPELAKLAEQFGSAGAGDAIEQGDIELKRLKLGQGVSDAVQDGFVNIGDFYNATDNTVLGNSKKPAEFFIFYMDKVWLEFDLEYDTDKGQNVRVFKNVLPVTPDNADLDYLDEENKIARDFTYNFYMLSAEEIAKGACIPYVFSLNRVQTKAAKSINAKILELKGHNPPLASFLMAFEFTTQGKTKGDKKWQQVIVNAGRLATEAEAKQSEKWYEIIKAQVGNLKVQGEEAGKPKATEAKGETVDDDDVPF